ncbi:MAG: hypothetical protein D3905_03765 [Candidatus Electrothrix sp. AS4_5]|nr:hypothetical protein [Candidatus Electrothrix gigas]
MRLGNFSVEILKGRELDSGYVAMKHNTKYALRLSNIGDRRCDAEVEIDGKLVGVWRIPSNKHIVIERPTHDTGCFTFYKAETREAKKAQLVQSGKLGLISVLFKPEKKLDCYFDFDDDDIEFCLDCNGEDSDELDLCLSLDDTEEGLEAGGTGLSGKSEQEFRTADFDFDDDEQEFCTADFDFDDDDIEFCLDCNGEDSDELDLCLSLDDTEEGLEAGGTGLSGKSEQEFRTAQPIDYDETGFVQINLRLVCETDEPRPLTPVSTPIPPPLL